MKCTTHTFTLHTRGHADVHDVTPMLINAIAASEIHDGIATIFVPGSTAGVTTIEFEAGVVQDLKDALERLVPEKMHYAHNARWGDGNGFSHIRAALLSPSLTIPLTGGQPQLGTWQQAVLVDFDNRPRNREVIITIMGS